MDWHQFLSRYPVRKIQPITPSLELLRHSLVGSPLPEPALTLLAKLAVFTITLLPLSILALTYAVDFTRRRGTILEV